MPAPGTRNLRLTAIRSFFRFVSFEEPAHSALIQRVLAIPSKRHNKRQVHFLDAPEIEAIASPRPIGRRGSAAAIAPFDAVVAVQAAAPLRS